MILNKLKKINVKIKLFFGIVIGIIGSFFLINQRKNSFERKNQKDIDNINKNKGKDLILEENLERNSHSIDDINNSISSVRNNIDNIDKKEDGDEIDNFFDKRGF